jgi:hypothetical protein
MADHERTIQRTIEMKKFTKTFVMFFCILSCLSVLHKYSQAANWSFVNSSGGVSHYIDVDSIHVDKAGVNIKVWEKLIYSNGKYELYLNLYNYKERYL